jgi:adenylyltransferase/sulfurtransferase
MNTELFSSEELARYNRHIIIPGFGIEAQARLKQARVLVVGTGGLGSPVLLYLAAAGVGTLGIVDFDVVDDSNLQRQILYSIHEVGTSKVEAAAARLKALNPYICIEIHNTRLTSDNALELIGGYDVVADGTDNFQTRYLVNDACVLLGKTNVYASIFQFEGQVSVFNHRFTSGEVGPNYRDLYAEPPPPGLVPSCAEGGVLGVLPGIIGSLQALEVIKVITGLGEPLAGRLFLFDALSFSSRTLTLHRDPLNPLNGQNPTQTSLIDYEEFCGLKQPEPTKAVRQLSVQEFERLRGEANPPVVIDVREPHEYAIAHLNGTLIPLGELEKHLDKIPRDQPVVVHCKLGGRSAKAIQLLQDVHKYDNLYNLQGGIIAYATDINPTLTKY